MDKNTLHNITPEELLHIGANAFTEEIKKMIEQKVIAPYQMVTERDNEIKRLKQKIKELEAKTNAI